MAPSFPHEALVRLFRERPRLAAELVRDALHTPVPAFREAHVEDAQLGAITPTELQADLVVRLEGNNADLGRKVLAESGLNIIAATSLTDAAQQAVKAAGGKA